MKESLQNAFDQSQQVSKDVENIQSRIDHGIDTLLTDKPTIKENLQIVDELEAEITSLRKDMGDLVNKQKGIFTQNDHLQKSWKAANSSLEMLQQNTDKRRSQLQQNLRQQKELEEKARLEAEARTKAEAKAKSEAESRAKSEAESRAKSEAEARAKSEAEARAKADAEARAKTEAEEKAKAKAAAEAKAKADAEAKAKTDAEAKAKEDAEAKRKAEAESKAKAEAEAKQRSEKEQLKSEIAATQAKADLEAVVKTDQKEAERLKTEQFLKHQSELINSITSIKASLKNEIVPESSSESYIVLQSYIAKAISDHQNKRSEIDVIVEKAQSVIKCGDDMVHAGMCGYKYIRHNL